MIARHAYAPLRSAIIGLTAGVGFAFTASMPTNRATPTAASARLQRIAIDALKAADELIAQPLNEDDAELHLAAPTAIIAMVLDHLEDRVYRAEKLDQSHRAEDMRLDRLLAGV